MQPSAKGFTALLKFNVELTHDLTLFDFQIVRAPSGKLLVYAPSGKSGQPTLSMAPALRSAIIELADDALKDCELDQHAA